MKRPRIDIDFAERRPPSRWPAVVLLGAMLSVSALWAAWQWQARTAALESQLSEAVAAHEPEPLRIGDAEQRRLNHAAEALGFDWPELMSRLELRVAKSNVRLTALDIRASGGEIKLAGHVHDSATLLAFAEALRLDPLLAGLRLTRQEAPGDGATRLLFTMEGRVPGAAGHATLAP